MTITGITYNHECSRKCRQLSMSGRETPHQDRVDKSSRKFSGEREVRVSATLNFVEVDEPIFYEGSKGKLI
jgi:hypothetical protein